MKTFITKRAVLIGGFTLSAAIAALTVGTFVDPQASTASAQSVAARSSQATAKLSADEKAKLNISVNVQDQLKDAQSAKDLEVLTYDQLKTQYKYILPPDDNSPVKLEKLKKFLKYTNKDGATVVLGLDSHNLPVFAVAMMGDPKAGPGAGNGVFHTEGHPASGEDNGPEFGTSNGPIEVHRDDQAAGPSN